MKFFDGMRIRDGARSGLLESVTETSVNVRWFEKSMLDSEAESVSFSDPRLNQIELLTLTHGWTSMAEATNANKGTARSLVDDIRSLLEEVEPADVQDSEEDVEVVSEEAAEVVEAEGDEKPKKVSGKSLEKKAREKRKKKGGGGHNPFKTKKALGPGPRHGRNSETKNWKCSCSTPYKCNCHNKDGRTKVIRIKRGYKKAYNHEYKQWRKGQKG